MFDFDDVSEWLHERRKANAYQEGVEAGEDAADDEDIQASFDDGYEEGHSGNDGSS